MAIDAEKKHYNGVINLKLISVRHVLIDCIDLGLITPLYYSVPDMKASFDSVSVDRISSFVKEINLFSKI